MKPINPYLRLKSQFSKWVDECILRERVPMGDYPKNELRSLVDVWQRTIAAKQLGYDVQLVADDKGLYVEYVKKLPKRPDNV